MPCPRSPVAVLRHTVRVLRLFAVLVVPTAVIGFVIGLGPLAVVGGFVALFASIGVSGGALRSDLSTLAVLAPLFLVGAVGPRLLDEVSRPAAFVLILVLVAVAALLPVRRPHLATAGLGLGLATLISYGLPVTGGGGQLLLAVVIGLAVAAIVRVLSGFRDPHRATRHQVASLLDAPEPSLVGAVDLWLRDGRPTWLGRIIETAVRARTSLAAVEAAQRRGASPGVSDDDLEGLRARMRDLADQVRAARPGDDVGPAAGPIATGTLSAALSEAEKQNSRRDTAPAAGTDGLRARLDDAVAIRRTSWRSAQVRHAVRTTLGVLVALLISLRLRPGDPLLVTLLMTTFSILQTSWSATLQRARPKIVGLALGALVTAVLVIALPAVALVPVALVALLVGLGNVTSRPLLGNSALVVVSVGFNTSLRALDPWATLAEYAVLTIAAVVIGVVLGFGLVPGLRPPPVRARLERAVAGTAAALRAVADGADDRRSWTSRHWQEAQRAREDLVADGGRLDDVQAAGIERVRLGLGDLAVLGLLTARDDDGRRDVLDAADRLEHGEPAPAANRTEVEVEVMTVLADDVHREWRTLDDALGPRGDGAG